MKNVNFFIIALFTFFSSVFSHSSEEKWFIRGTAHDINFYPVQSPFKGFFLKRNNSFTPIISSLGLEHKINDYIGLYSEGSIGIVNNNKWRISNNFFLKLSQGVNLYVFPYQKFDPYLRLGAGYHRFNNYINRELRVSDVKYFKTNSKNFFLLDGGGGINLWLIPNLGINLESTYNQIVEPKSKNYLNFWKHNIGFIFRFGKNTFKKNKENKNMMENKYDLPSKEEKNFYEEKICCKDKDIDNDGVLDKDDLCPNQFGLKKFKGCPDTDLDNIPDYEDKCPNKFGKKENGGCPNVVFNPILFNMGKYSLSNHSLVIIKDIANMMNNYFPNSKFYINGYADSHGKFYQNKILSIKRANSVFEALVNRGINPSRIEIRGLGSSKKYKKGRRVEIIIQKKK
ncbi:OmpA family protein [Blattabacterium cuenoti]|uniref:OmpA family protein n=1 Tax=Blattabacterium cuenoti TaxID=1653831 RepID=UPI00163BB9A2|nr:OmpA family protein [Blattabacterium cuenoti]